jgi:hypothetical protein
MENKNTLDELHEQMLLKILQREKNVSKVVDRYLRMRLKRRIRKFTGIKIK